MSAALTDFIGLRHRLLSGEPIRILVGHQQHNAAEIIPSARWIDGLRATLLDQADAEIAKLTQTEEGEIHGR